MTRAYSEVAREVRAAGLLGRARWFYVLVGAGLLAGFVVLAAAFVALGSSWWQLAVAAGLGVLLTQCAFLAHEASHRAVLQGGPANDRLGRFVATFVVGTSYAWWMNKHSRHHANPNQVGKDPDISFEAIVFTPEAAQRHSGLRATFTRRQGYLFFPLLLLEGVNLHVQSVRSLLVRGPVAGRALELGLIVAHFALYLGALVWFLPPGLALAFLGVQLAVFGLYMGAAFAPNHKGMPIVGADERLDFFSKQVRTSRNIAGGWWATALLGGLNYQVEHHLFPSMPRPHLARTRLLVRAHCRSLGVPYTETTLMQSYGIVVRYLNEVGLAARDPWTCPTLDRFRGV
ncbi:acyl-CoA desaturase [Cellulomonas sp.]|uniref:fatty acid desaturase family protein n=1 Tax=Cellulomonas sp. TaxID=40001 RepID=UPI00338F68E2